MEKNLCNMCWSEQSFLFLALDYDDECEINFDQFDLW